MRVTMIGAGYVGLVSGACFADFGHTVTCVDKQVDKIRQLQKGKIPIFEPGLDNLVAKNIEEKRLDFTTDLADSVHNSDAVFIAVGTPSPPQECCRLNCCPQPAAPQLRAPCWRAVGSFEQGGRDDFLWRFLS